ncbi:hypothetical protein MUK42_00989 [Musa troglodytarum]|uniref:Uncharacterized protein n=1 Tax=Musa troglodytarum TaxID=320322 RepID=A0A9E7EQD0_9LILI|nr:hypothetical protein MUK42_00989 [Musa troglodytarum]
MLKSLDPERAFVRRILGPGESGGLRVLPWVLRRTIGEESPGSSVVRRKFVVLEKWWRLDHGSCACRTSKTILMAPNRAS